MSIATACASGNNALGEAARMVAYGSADVMVSGGSEAAITELLMAGFNNMKALSTRNDDPQTASRPFDIDRDGFVMSEGAAVLILEALDHAVARGARIYGELLGYGTSADAFHITAPHENGTGAILSMQRALADAGVTTDDIDYINAHGTSTQLNDRTETMAVKKVFGDRAYAIPMSSTKSMHGHLLGATSALEALISIKGMEANTLPPTINYQTPDPDCDLDYVTDGPRSAEFNTFMSNGFGFGGHNATIIVRRLTL
jgi:3-oxoacyl-[acyl-carrier-protein] synthase II